MILLIEQIWSYLQENNDSIQLIAGIVVIIGIIQAEIIWVFRPRLKIYFNKNKTFDIAPDGIRNIDEVKWIHVFVKNYGFRRAENCNGYILKITRKVNRTYQITKGFETDVYIHQHWANEPGAKAYSPQMIEGRCERRLDLCYLDKGNNILKLFTESQYCGVSVALEKGEYKILMAVSGKNASTVKRWFYLEWDGSWEGFKIRGLYNSFKFYFK